MVVSHHSTCDPPPEQLLVGLGVGGVSFVNVGGCGHLFWGGLGGSA